MMNGGADPKKNHGGGKTVNVVKYYMEYTKIDNIYYYIQCTCIFNSSVLGEGDPMNLSQDENKNKLT